MEEMDLRVRQLLSKKIAEEAVEAATMIAVSEHCGLWHLFDRLVCHIAVLIGHQGGITVLCEESLAENLWERPYNQIAREAGKTMWKDQTSLVRNDLEEVSGTFHPCGLIVVCAGKLPCNVSWMISRLTETFTIGYALEESMQ